MSYTIPFQLGSSCKCGSEIRRISETTGPLAIAKHLLAEEFKKSLTPPEMTLRLV